MSYLFLVHIGPVQDFIASARRSRDLAFGSWFLSEISRAAAQAIRAQGGMLIFPAPEQEEMLAPYAKGFNVANKILALMKQPPQECGKEGLGHLVSKAIMEQLDDIKKNAYAGIQLSPENSRTAEQQIRDFVEFFWVALPYDAEDTASYAPTRLRLEALMGARKNTRDFSQMKGANVPKSSIDGQIESVIPENEFPSNKETEQEQLAKIRQLYWKYGAGPAERLSGVDLLKRHGLKVWKDRKFPSTGHMAARPFLERLRLLDEPAQKEAQIKWDAYIEKAKQLGKPRVEAEYVLDNASLHPILQHYDGTMLFEERLVDLVGVAVDQKQTQEKIQEAKNALRAFYQCTDSEFTKLGLSKEPDPYYALLQADGDSMGNIIDAQAEHGHERHRQLSQVLARFATEVDTIVKKHQGALVYAGGDDVLAFLPLHTVLQCANDLATRFRDELKGFAYQNGHPTLSVGIAIVHYLDSLKHARNLAFDAQQRAKQIDNKKDALAITVSKRSGEDYTIVGKWGIVDARLEEMIAIYRSKDAIPNGTAYELRDMLLRLTTTGASSEELIKTLPEIMRWDALRILKRKLYVPRGKFSQEEAEKIEKSFKMRLGIKDEEQQESEQEITPLQKYQRFTKDLTQFINELIIAQVLADARQMAQSEKEMTKS